jgi:chromosome segregation ATPase
LKYVNIFRGCIVTHSFSRIQQELNSTQAKLYETEDQLADFESLKHELKKELSEKENRITYYQDHVKILQTELDNQVCQLLILFTEA